MRAAPSLFSATLLGVGLCTAATPGIAFQDEPAPVTRATGPAQAQYTLPTQAGLEIGTVPATEGPAPGSPAEKAGFKINDRILRLDGKPAGNTEAFLKAIAALPPKAAVKVTILRSGEELELSATLDEFAPAPQPADGKPPISRGDLDCPSRTW